MRESPDKRAGDGSAIGLPHEPHMDPWQAAKSGATWPTTVQVQEDADCARDAVSDSGSEAGGPAASLPMTPPPEARTDWPRGIGELGTEGMDASQPLNEKRTRTGRLSPD
jgi:hypothetical protein